MAAHGRNYYNNNKDSFPGAMLPIIEMLLNNGAVLNRPFNALATIIQDKNWKSWNHSGQGNEAIRFLLERGADASEILAKGNLPGRTNQIKRLTDAGLDAKKSHGATPLHFASEKGNAVTVQHLLQSGRICVPVGTRVFINHGWG